MRRVAGTIISSSCLDTQLSPRAMTREASSKRSKKNVPASATDYLKQDLKVALTDISTLYFNKMGFLYKEEDFDVIVELLGTVIISEKYSTKLSFQIDELLNALLSPFKKLNEKSKDDTTLEGQVFKARLAKSWLANKCKKVF